MTTPATDSPFTSRLAVSRFILLCGTSAVVLGAAILAGWGLELPWLISLRREWPIVPPSSAAALLLCGLSVCGAATSGNRVAPLTSVSRAGAIVLVLGAVLKLSAIVLAWQAIPDMLGFHQIAGAGSVPSAQTGMLSALEFSLLGMALLLCQKTGFGGTFEALTLSAAALAWLDLYNYLCADTPLPPFAHVSPLTATACLLLSGAIFCMRMDAGRAQILFSNSAGGTLARRLLPPTLLLPLAIGWLRLKTQQVGWLSADGAALTFELANSLLIGTCVWVTARFLHRSSAKRRQVEQAMRENIARLATIVATEERAKSSQAQAQLFRGLLDRANDLIYVADAVSGRVLDCNAALPKRLGYTYEEVGQLFVWELSTAAGAPTDWTERVARVQVSGSLVIESDYRCKDGTMLPVEINLRYVEDPQPLLIVVTRDVTERRLQETRAAHFTRILKMQSAIHGAVLRIRNPDEFLQEACRVAVELGGYPRAIISMVDPEGRHVLPKYRFGITSLQTPESFPIGDGSEADRSVTGRAVRLGEVVVCEDLQRSQPPVVGRDELLHLGIRSIVALPLIVEGARLGALTLLSESDERMPDEELMLLQDVAATLGLGLRSQQQADAAQFLTHYDPLTGLAKRALFCDHLNSFIHEGSARLSNPVIAVFDVQDLSSVNDTFGRSFGDALVQRVAERARLAVENERFVGHLGGGTFALAMRTFRGVADSAAAAIDHTVFEQPFEIEGRSVRVTCRSGMARFPADGQEAATLLQKAEAALRQAKESGERHLNFKLQMRSDVARRLQLEHELRDALDGGQFVLYYQPQVSIATGRITSVEALLRWRKPQGGLVLPAQFLPVLESSEMIVPVGDWVLKQAAHDCRQCLNRGLIPLRISINVSALQIRRRGFVEEILAVVEPFGSAAAGVDIEITESSVLQDLEDTRRKLQRLRDAGVRIAIDDFGTGYSSLSLLPTLPVDILKIDRSFIQGLPGDPASLALTSSIIQIASSFGLATVAEGVESTAQLELLRTLKCHQSQGYLHFRPMPIADLQALLERQAAGSVAADAAADAAGWRADSLAV